MTQESWVTARAPTFGERLEPLEIELARLDAQDVTR